MWERMPVIFSLRKSGESVVLAGGFLAGQAADANAATLPAIRVVRATEVRNKSSNAVPGRLNPPVCW